MNHGPADGGSAVTSLRHALRESIHGFGGSWTAFLLDQDTALLHDHMTGRLARVKPEFMLWLTRARLEPGQLARLLGWTDAHGQ